MYKTGQVVQVYSNSAKDWLDAKVISIENGLVTVNYSGPDGDMMSKTLRETDLSDLRLKEQATSSSAIFLISSQARRVKKTKEKEKERERNKFRLESSETECIV